MDVLKQAYDALSVIATDDHIRGYLFGKDPKALAQVAEARLALEREMFLATVPAGYRPAFGVPYARAVMVGGNAEGKECPRCGKVIVTTQRKDAESFSGVAYAEHYDREHAADDGRILINGQWYERE
jgi:hypothetical protein